jgi:RNA polymerase sigma-70 factor (ECF subfamily)
LGSSTGTKTELHLLLERIAARDADALKALYDRTSASVFGLAVRILRNASDAEEVTLDVYHRLWLRAASYDSNRGSVWTLLSLMARSIAIDRLRAARSRLPAADAEHAAEEPMSPEPNPEVEHQAAEGRRRILQAMQTLSAKQRQAVELAFFEGLTHEEIAARLREPLGTIKGRIRAGLSILRSLLGREGLGD